MSAAAPEPIVLDAGAPLLPARHPVGRRSALLSDPDRDGRTLALECWYPAAVAEGERAVSDILPGVGFRAAAHADAPPAAVAAPFVVWSHGRTGTNVAYTLLCESLAARGFVVAAPNHPGDTLMDWMLGAHADDATNEAQRVGDVRFVIDTFLAAASPVTEGITLDAARIAVAGHSYGGWTAFATAGAQDAHPAVRAVAGLQSFTRSLGRAALERLRVPTLMLVGERDTTTPPETDADRAAHLLRDNPQALRIDIAAAGHQACSDVGLYLELEPQVEGLPDIVREYVRSMADGVTGSRDDPWRPTVALHADLLGTWLEHVLDIESAAAARFAGLIEGPGIALRLGGPLR